MITTVMKRLTAPFVFILSLFLAAGTTVYADNRSDLQSLTKATLELHAELLAAEKKISNVDQQLLSLFLDIDGLTGDMLQRIVITLDGKTIVEHEFTAEEHSAMIKGGMMRLYSEPLPEGRYKIRTLLTGKEKNQRINSSLTLTKKAGDEYLKITATSLPHQNKHALFFEQGNAL